MLSLVTWALVFVPIFSPRADEEAFDRGLHGIQILIAQSSFEQAEEELGALLETHRERDYVWLRRARIVEALRLCRFLPTYEYPKPESLVSGKLHKYSPSTGQMRISYTNGDLRDFRVQRESGEWVFGEKVALGEKDFLIHPAQFDRGYSIKVKGSSYGGRLKVLPQVGLYLSPWSRYVVSFGLPASGRLDRPAFIFGLGEKEGVLDQARSPAERGAPYELEVRVKPNEVLGLWNGKRVLRAKKNRKDFGMVGMIGVADWEEIEISGVARRSWMRGLQDEAFQVDVSEFAVDFDENEAVPEWLRFERVDRDEYLASNLPLGTPEEMSGHVSELFGLVDSDSPEKAKKHAKSLNPKKVGLAFDLYSRLLLEYANQEFTAAIKACDELLEVDPDFLPARFLRAWMEGLLDPPQGVESFGELATEFPEDARFPGARALLALLNGDREEGEAFVRAAVGTGLYGDELDHAADLISKAGTGPFWLESHVHETEHFRIVSDIDKRTCREAGDILETALGYYQKRYVPLSKDRTARFPVYIFSGETGYQFYLIDITFFPAENSAGVYLPSLKQLLIWNTPDRADMLNTVRHEGLHQYMDHVVGDHPRWLAEGLGEYWESADFSKGRLQQNAPTKEKVSAVNALRKEFTPLEEFLRLEPRGFMEKAGLHYTQAWAFVHFLHHGGGQEEELFDQLLQALVDGASPSEAVEEVFGEEDLEGLQADFMKYCRNLD